MVVESTSDISSQLFFLYLNGYLIKLGSLTNRYI